MRSNGLTPYWNNVRNVLRAVVGRRCTDSDEARRIQTKLNGITDCCSCRNDEARLNQTVKILEDEGVGARNTFKWFAEVMDDSTIGRSDLAEQIRRKIQPAPGPVY
jgi:hypothetical protein